jgi:hypothetical protein
MRYEPHDYDGMFIRHPDVYNTSFEFGIAIAQTDMTTA